MVSANHDHAEAVPEVQEPVLGKKKRKATMKAKGVYVYGVWCPERGWEPRFTCYEDEAEQLLKNSHTRQGCKKARVKRIYIAPPKGKKS